MLINEILMAVSSWSARYEDRNPERKNPEIK